MTSIRLYGLSNCDTCRKAKHWLDRFSLDYHFVDYRAQPISADTLKEWARQLGGWERLINCSSTTWRKLPPDCKLPGSDAQWALLIKEYPVLVRRPVVLCADGSLSVGFSENGFRELFGF